MTMVDIHDCVPPGPSGQHIGVLLGVGIEPMEVLVRVAVAASFMVLVSGSEIGWLVFVSTVGIAMTMIISVL